MDLRPIYPKKDEYTITLVNLRLLPYWLVYTVRCQLKVSGINHGWREIVRIGYIQKKITTSGYNKAGKEIKVHKCSEQVPKLKALQTALKVKLDLSQN